MTIQIIRLNKGTVVWYTRDRVSLLISTWIRSALDFYPLRTPPMYRQSSLKRDLPECKITIQEACANAIILFFAQFHSLLAPSCDQNSQLAKCPIRHMKALDRDEILGLPSLGHKSRANFQRFLRYTWKHGKFSHEGYGHANHDSLGNLGPWNLRLEYRRVIPRICGWNRLINQLWVGTCPGVLYA